MSGYGVLIYLHVVSAFAFVLVHGVSAFVAFQVKRERDPERLRVLLALSASTYGAMYLSLGGIVLTGVAAGFQGAHWGSGWIWVSLVVLAATVGVMSMVAGRDYSPLRKALGMPYFERNRPQPAQAPTSPEAIAAAALATRPVPLAAVGIVALVILLWLMMFKPF